MTVFDLSTNYHSEPESSGSHVREVVDKFQGSPPPHKTALMAAQRCINNVSAPSSANVRTGPEMNIGDGSFKLKLALINMV
jgi:hypothetical protein